jgi:hypothetical protein
LWGKARSEGKILSGLVFILSHGGEKKMSIRNESINRIRSVCHVLDTNPGEEIKCCHH